MSDSSSHGQRGLRANNNEAQQTSRDGLDMGAILGISQPGRAEQEHGNVRPSQTDITQLMVSMQELLAANQQQIAVMQQEMAVLREREARAERVEVELA